MIDRLVTLCFDRRAIVWLVFALVALYGAYSWKQLPVEAYPDIADVTSQIVTQVPGLGAEESSSRSPSRWSARCWPRPACMCCAPAACLRCR